MKEKRPHAGLPSWLKLETACWRIRSHTFAVLRIRVDGVRHVTSDHQCLPDQKISPYATQQLFANTLRLSSQVCKQFVIDPTDAKKAQSHRDDCSTLAAKLAKRVRDSSVECGICLEKVMAKAEMSQRRFGLMACEHAFCLGCIRNWRATGEVNAKTALRTCPICRTTTHFITPSTSWPESPAEKEEIVEAYKASMAEKDCVHFDFGDGTCPFGTSCFYRHAYKDGRLQEVQLRRAGNADGDVKVIAPVTLSSFLEASLTAQLALSSGRRSHRPQQRRQQQTQSTAQQQQTQSSAQQQGGEQEQGGEQQQPEQQLQEQQEQEQQEQEQEQEQQEQQQDEDEGL